MLQSLVQCMQMNNVHGVIHACNYKHVKGQEEDDHVIMQKQSICSAMLLSDTHTARWSHVCVHTAQIGCMQLQVNCTPAHISQKAALADPTC